MLNPHEEKILREELKKIDEEELVQLQCNAKMCEQNLQGKCVMDRITISEKGYCNYFAPNPFYARNPYLNDE